MMRHLVFSLGLLLCLPTLAFAAEWTLNSADSRLNFGSIKAGTVGESHSFGALEGKVDANGEVALAVGLASVATNIDIRNERMRQFLFQTDLFPKAKVTGQVDLETLEAVAPGDALTMPLDLTLDLHGVTRTIAFDARVTRLADDKAQIIPAQIIFLDPEGFELNPGIDKLMELAGLPSIARAVPVTFELIFTRVAN